MSKGLLSALMFFLSISYTTAQRIKVSSFSSDPNKAILMAVKTNFDTLVLDKDTKWIFAPIRIENARNKTIILEPGTDIKAKPGTFLKKTDALLKLVNCQGITILGNGGTLVMNKEEYVDGEWRHGLSLRGSSDIVIRDLTIRDSGGDGIYIAGAGKGTYSENISISNVKCLNNKRQGMSIISAKNVFIKGCEFADTKGTLPGAGLDFEPNTAEDVISGIEITDCVFRNNEHSGIKFALRTMRSHSAPITITIKNSVISNNHSPTHPRSAAEILFDANKDDPVQGKVVFENCIIENSKWGLFYSRKRADAFQVIFQDCIARNICSTATWPVIYLEVPDYKNKTGPLGGYTFNNLFVSYETDVRFMIVRGSRLGTLENLKDINGEVTLKNTGSENIKYINYNPENNLNVDFTITRKY